MARNIIQQLLLFSLISHLAHAIPSNSASTPREALDILHRRQNTCPTQAPLSCTAVDPKLPSNFCCKTGTTCISLDSSSTALCCPDGSSCASIHPVSCDVNLQDPSKSPLQPLFTKRLSDSLASCGNSTCCPFGYTCGTGTDGSAVCKIVASKAITQSASSSTPTTSTTSSTSRSSTSSTPSTASSASASGIDSTNPQSRQSSEPGNPFPPGVFLAGFFPGILVGALGVLAWVILTGRHKKSDDNASTTSSVYRKKPYISNPVVINKRNTRTSLALRGRSLFGKRHQSEGTPGLPFDTWKMPTPPEPNNIPDQPMGKLIPAGPTARATAEPSNFQNGTRFPHTPQRQIYGGPAQPGSETIHVYTPRDVEYPSATVAPLRGMNQRNVSRTSTGISPYVTPDRPTDARTLPPSTMSPVSPYGGQYETLTPARYGDGQAQRRMRPDNTVPQSRPETTFTAMLQEINFPDPMSRQNPRMPNVPNQYR